MVIGNFSNTQLIEDLISRMSSLTTFIQAIGGLVLLYILFNIINAIINKGKRKELSQMNKNLEEIKVLSSGKKRKK